MPAVSDLAGQVRVIRDLSDDNPPTAKARGLLVGTWTVDGVEHEGVARRPPLTRPAPPRQCLHRPTRPERRTLAREQTPNGEIALARRGDVEELIIDGVFAMDSLDRSSEDALADALGSPPGRVLVGGLGLGYTAARLLATGAAHVTVVELAAPLVAWANDGLTPTLATVTRDPRATIVTGDIAAALTGELPGTEGPFDAIALDVDNGPSFLIHQRNRALYDAPLLTAALNQLTPRRSPRDLVRAARRRPGAHAGGPRTDRDDHGPSPPRAALVRLRDLPHASRLSCSRARTLAAATAPELQHLQHAGHQIGDRRALRALQGHVREQRIALEPLDHGDDPVVAPDAEVVALGDVVGQHHA